MGALLTTASTLQCPHGGMVTAASAGGSAMAGAPVLTAADTFTIAGCPFATPAGPQPCLTVQWVSTATRVNVGGAAVLTEASVGLCIGAAPQGAVVIAATQSRASGL